MILSLCVVVHCLEQFQEALSDLPGRCLVPNGQRSVRQQSSSEGSCVHNADILAFQIRNEIAEHRVLKCVMIV